MKLDSKLDDQAACWQRKYNQGKSQGSSVLTKHQEMRHSWFGCELWEAACPPLATAGTTPRETEELRSWLNAKTLQGMACLLCWLMPCKHYRDPKERRMVRDHCVPQIKPAVVTQKRVTVSLQHSSSGNSLSLLLQAFNTWPLWEPTCLLDMKKSGWSMFHTCETKWRLLPTAFLPIILSEAFVVTVSTHISPSPCGAWLFHGNQRPVPYSHQHPGVLGGQEDPAITDLLNHNRFRAVCLSALCGEQNEDRGSLITSQCLWRCRYSGCFWVSPICKPTPTDLRTANPFSIGFIGQLCSALLLSFYSFSLFSHSTINFYLSPPLFQQPFSLPFSCCLPFVPPSFSHSFPP